MNNVTPRPGLTPPQQVITVVHRLSGWKLLSLLASRRMPRVLGVDDLPLTPDVHTNIVAGYVTSDGRTIIACLPQAEVEAEASMPPKLFGGFPNMQSEESELSVVRGDGVEFKATFVGLDASTGLSLLEVAEPIVPPAPAPPAAPSLTEGQHVRLFAPGPVEPTAASAATTPASQTPAPEALAATEAKLSEGDAGVVYAGMGAVEAQLAGITRAPTGKAIKAAVRGERLSPEWTGAIALNDAGALVGIVAPGGGEDNVGTQLIPADVIKGAASRVLARRGSVPQPWLGARGETVAAAPLDKFLANGWPRDEAQALLGRRLGVLLTSVAPGTPAALAGLRPGDVVSRIDTRQVNGLDDFSFFLKEAGGGSTLDFTVLRAAKQLPLKMAVRLSEAQNPASATGEAEARALLERARMFEADARVIEAKAKTAEAEARADVERARRAEREARAAGDARRVEEAERRIAEGVRKIAAAQTRAGEAIKQLGEAINYAGQAERRLAELSRTRFGLLGRMHLIEGLDAIGISQKLAARFQAQGGLLVISVRPDSRADTLGLRAGDVIETIDGKLIPAPDESLDPRPDNLDNLTLGVVRAGQKLTFQLPRR